MCKDTWIILTGEEELEVGRQSLGKSLGTFEYTMHHHPTLDYTMPLTPLFPDDR